jgi:hypothetical protein
VRYKGVSGVRRQINAEKKKKTQREKYAAVSRGMEKEGSRQDSRGSLRRVREGERDR